MSVKVEHDISAKKASKELFQDITSSILDSIPLTRPNLPKGFTWCEPCDLQIERVQAFLSDHYVASNVAASDQGHNIRYTLQYSKEILKWYLCRNACLVGIETTENRKIVGFISAVPTLVDTSKRLSTIAEVNFLCVHHRLRGKRLAAVLIKELLRCVLISCNQIRQAIFTGDVSHSLPLKPLVETRFFHRPLDVDHLIDCNFFSPDTISPMLTRERARKLYNVNSIKVSGGLKVFRRLMADDNLNQPDVVDQLAQNMNTLPQTCIIRRVYSVADVSCLISCRDMYVYISDQEYILFYEVPTRVENELSGVVSVVRGAYLYKISSPDALASSLQLAAHEGFHVMNALCIGNITEDCLKSMKFVQGTGCLNYYVYNGTVHSTLSPDKIYMSII